MKSEELLPQNETWKWHLPFKFWKNKYKNFELSNFFFKEKLYILLICGMSTLPSSTLIDCNYYPQSFFVWKLEKKNSFTLFVLFFFQFDQIHEILSLCFHFYYFFICSMMMLQSWGQVFNLNHSQNTNWKIFSQLAFISLPLFFFFSFLSTDILENVWFKH